MYQIFRDIPYRDPKSIGFSQIKHKLDLYVPLHTGKETLPVMIYMHGGAWMIGDRAQTNSKEVGKTFALKGYIVAVVSYRLSRLTHADVWKAALLQVIIFIWMACSTDTYEKVVWFCLTFLILIVIIYIELIANSTLNRCDHPAQAQDCADSIGWVHKNIHHYNGNPREIILCGHSAGAHLASLVVLDPQYFEKKNVPPTSIVCVVGISGPYCHKHFQNTRMSASVGDVVFGKNRDKWKYAFPMYYAENEEECAPHVPPFLLLNAELEYGLKIHGRAFYHALKKKGVNVSRIICEKINHFNIVAFWKYQNRHIPLEIEAFTKKCLLQHRSVKI